MDKPKCKTCEYYDPEASVRVYVENFQYYDYTPLTSTTMQAKYAKGACKRHASTSGWHKSPNDFCGDHNLFPVYLDGLKQDGQPNS